MKKEVLRSSIVLVDEVDQVVFDSKYHLILT